MKRIRKKLWAVVDKDGHFSGSHDGLETLCRTRKDAVEVLNFEAGEYNQRGLHIVRVLVLELVKP